MSSNKRSRASMEASGGGKEQAPSGFVRLHAKPAAASESVVGAPALSLAIVNGEDVRMTVPAVRLHIGTFEAGTGTLYVTTERVAWLEDGASGAGYSLAYPKIALHAVCKDLATFPDACIFCQLTGSGAMEEDDDDEEDGEEAADSAIPRDASSSADSGEATTAAAAAGSGDHQQQRRRVAEDGSAVPVRASPNLSKASELRLVPTAASITTAAAADAGASAAGSNTIDNLLETLFQTLSACAELHPDGGFDGDFGDDNEGGSGIMMMMGDDGDDEEGAAGASGAIFRFFNGQQQQQSGEAGVEGASASSLPFGAGGWIGDPSVLAQLGLPSATDADTVFAEGPGAASSDAAKDSL